MSKLEWDKIGERFYETGVEKTVLYLISQSATYSKGVAWSGVTGIDENPSGAETSPVYADNKKYLNLVSAEEYAATLKAYTYPDEFGECDGSAEIVKGVRIGQQPRKMFGLCYQSKKGNDVKKTEYGYIIHFIYGAQAAPSSKSHNTINDSPEATEMSWEISTTPVDVEGHSPTATLEIDSTKCDPEKLAALEDIIYGTEETEARLPLPNEIMEIVGEAVAVG